MVFAHGLEGTTGHAEWLDGRPSAYSTEEDGSLSLTTSPGTDWWTFPGHNATNGPAYVTTVSESHIHHDFVASLLIDGNWIQQYDQGTLFLHLTTNEETKWIKAGVERENEFNYISAVVTQKYSDWSILSPPPALDLSNQAIRIYAERKKGDLVISFGSKESTHETSTMMREVKGFFHDLKIRSFNIGAMACSPSKLKGVSVLFSDFRLEWRDSDE
ncbi:hypothetical protein V1525DRAFT_389521 [Lipomyces kononenkoae]|uniref:Uncharacterized protein n=1 Tax=Lipomyces kononenkoae TaxID=34357 RepID=A0ACC3SY88_LIPKO